MCLILFAHQARPDCQLIVAANRDEFHARPTAPLDTWRDHPHLMAGRDLQDGGTWMGLTRGGRFAAVTNFSEEPPGPGKSARSRGELTTQFLLGQQSPQEYLLDVATRSHLYRGFNLLVGDRNSLHYFCNRLDAPPRPLPPGIYGLSNETLDCPWPKVVRGKRRLQTLIENEAPVAASDLLALLNDSQPAPDEELPQRGRDIEMERRVSPLFIVSDQYGTRASTVMLIGTERAHVVEQSFASMGVATGRVARDVSLA